MHLYGCIVVPLFSFCTPSLFICLPAHHPIASYPQQPPYHPPYHPPPPPHTFVCLYVYAYATYMCNTCVIIV